VHDVNVLDVLIPEPGAIYLFDRGYTDFARLYSFHLCGAFFVIRAKSNLSFKRLYSHPIDKSTGLKCDQTIVLPNFYASQDYPEKFRRVKYFDPVHERNLVFLSNIFTLTFFGTSENAVKTQIWVAITVYVLIAIVKKRLNLDISLYTFLQILSVNMFEKVPILQLVTENDYKLFSTHYSNQLNLFD